MATRRTGIVAVQLLAALTPGCHPRCSADGETPSPRAPGAEPSAPRAAAEGAGSEPSGSKERMEERQGLVTALRAEGIDDPAVIAALTRVPRHRFVPEAYRDEAYANRPLPIGSGQTISQPFIVAAMTQSVSPKPNDVCLEIGTGSGYQAAVLAEICRKVYSIEYLPEVARFGERNLRGVGYEPERVELRVGDGYKGWPEHAPFDVIVVTAAPEQVPKPLLDQLRVGGRLVIPVGPEDGVQELELWVRRAPGDGVDAFERKTLMGVRFVPFLGDAGRE
ncbi:MAG TPA: protein-L-isoaspartate(D-aspartate) O-methyltransferase [Polyangiaceae bacterium]